MQEKVKLISSCLSSYTTVGDIITYNIVCVNVSNINFKDVFISTNLNKNLKFIDDSIKVNNIKILGEDIISGICIKKLSAHQKATITFDMKVISKDEDTISIKSFAECVFNEDNIEKSILIDSKSLLHIYNPSIHISKSVDKYNVSLNDKVTYTITIVNNGDTYLDKIILKDNICESLEIIEDSLTINSNTINYFDFKKGINVGSLGINDIVTIKYDVYIIGKGVSCKIVNETFATYTYFLENSTTGQKISPIISCDLNVSLSSFKQISIDEYINLAPSKDDIESVQQINTDINIKSYHTIKTPIATSNEGLALSGYKLIIHGEVSQIIRYSAKKPNNPIYSFEHEMPFSTFIILPNDYMLGSKIQIDSNVEYIHKTLVNPRCIFESLNISLKAKTLK